MQKKLHVGDRAGYVAVSSLQELFEPHGLVRALNGASLHKVVIRVEVARAKSLGGCAGSRGES